MAKTITAVTDTALARVRLDVDWTGPPQASTVTIQRVAANGAVTTVRSANPLQLTAGLGLTYDYEAALDEATYYQATSTDDPGVTLTSNTVTLPSNQVTWLKHPGKAYLSMQVRVTSLSDLVRPVEQGIHNVLGRSTPIATTMSRFAERGELTLHTYDAAERDKLLALLAEAVPLLLQTPGGYAFGSQYVSIGDVTEHRIGLGNEPTKVWDLPITVVDAPTGDVIGVGNTWSDALGYHASWGALLNVEGTWNGLLAGAGPEQPA